ncbi:hypothetical protein GWK75_04540 [Candidatus Saccharibacteria bacterium oral taxon 955]|nr:hypothetical protein GWK75_04540 [Candidatus Saccharibacteria bacterium oral taxon 955]
MKKTWQKKFRETLTGHRAFLNGSILEYVVVMVFFTFLSLCYMNFSVIGGDTKLFISEPGDATAGTTWNMGADKDMNPLLGHTDAVNYPDGANLGDPSQITSALISFPLWLLTRFVSPFMGTNIMQIIAFLLVSMSIYGLVKRLTGKWYIALFAGFSATFFPYHLFKTVNHIGNIFSWVFVFELGAFLYLWKRPSWRSSLAVALSIVAGYFTDGYYLLLSTVFATTLAIGIIIASAVLRQGQRKIVGVVKSLLVAVVMLVVLAAPIGYVQLTSGNQISKTLDRSTSTIKTELKVYASTKLDFLAPPPYNPFFHGQEWYYSMLRQKAQHSNKVESTLYIGYVILGLSVLGVVLFVWRIFWHKSFRDKIKLSDRSDRWFVVLSCIVLVSMPVMLSFMGPDKIYKFGLTIPTLAGILTDHIALWRVLARFILPMHAMLVLYASFTLYILLGRFAINSKKNVAQIAIVATLGLVCAAEYATTINTPLFDLAKMPKLYSYLKQRGDILAIGELPLQDSPIEVNGYYATAQYVHGKKLINNHVSKYNIGQFSALGTEENPETIDFLRARGADAVITRNKQCNNQPWGKLLYSEKIDLKSTYEAPPFRQASTDDHICLYKLNKQAPIDDSFITTSANYAREDTGSYSTSLGQPRVTMKITDSRQRPIIGRRSSVSVEAFSTGKLGYAWVALQNGEQIAKGELEKSSGQPATITFVAKTDDPITIQFTLTDGTVYVPEDVRLKNYRSTLISD